MVSRAFLRNMHVLYINLFDEDSTCAIKKNPGNQNQQCVILLFISVVLIIVTSWWRHRFRQYCMYFLILLPPTECIQLLYLYPYISCIFLFPPFYGLSRNVEMWAWNNKIVLSLHTIITWNNSIFVARA